MQSTTYKIFLRDGITNAKGESPVYVRLTENRKTTMYSLNVSVLPQNWDKEEKRVKRSDIEHIQKNVVIERAKERLSKCSKDMLLNETNIAKSEIIKTVRNEYGKQCFYEFITQKIATRKDFSSETRRTYTSQLTKLKQYTKDLDFKDITPEFIQRYTNYMIGDLKNLENTYYKSLSVLRTYCNWALIEGLIKTNPFKNVKIRKNAGKREYLEEYELNSIENLFANTTSQRLKNVCRYFLFSCYTGLRFTDIKNLNWTNLKNQNLENVDTKVIELKMHKTKNVLSIPLIDKALKLIPEVRIMDKRIFKVNTNQVTNRFLKEIALLSGIDKQLTFHCARHTFATISLQKKIPMEVVSRILGHTNIKITQIYAKISNTFKYQELSKWN